MIGISIAFSVLEKIIGGEFSSRKRATNDLPFVYSKNFSIFKITGEFTFFYIIPKSNDIPLDIIKGLCAKLQSVERQRVVIYIDGMILGRRQYFIDSHISYISEDFDHRFFEMDAMLDLPNLMDDDVEDRYTKTTQQVVNFYLNNEIRDYSTREIANNHDFSFSSVSRANAFLCKIDAVVKNGVGTGAKYRIRSKKDLFEKVKKYLIYPIRKRKLVSLDEECIHLLGGYLSGENALSVYSDIEIDGDFTELAFDKRKFREIDDFINKNKGSKICYLEEFIYNPANYSDGNTISLLDAYIIARRRYEKNSDPRINAAIKQLENSIANEGTRKHR